MPKRRPSLAALRLAARHRLYRLLGRSLGPWAEPPPGLDLSPSARHFADYERAPLELRFAARSHADPVAWQQAARSRLAALTGFTLPDAIPEARMRETVPLPGGLQRMHLYLRAGPGVDIPVHIIRAESSAEVSGPVMLCLQGTNSGTHLSWGEARFPADLEKTAGDYAYALQAVANGYIAVAIEQSCFGERAERQIVPRSAAPCVDATMHALLLGRCLLGERCADVSAVVTWLSANAGKLGIDATRIHAMGHSAGGTVALFAAALDPRISAVMACGCIGPIRETIGRRRDDQGQNVVPGILNWMDMGDVVGLIAPRPFASAAGESDPIWPAAGARAVFDEAAMVYEAFGARDRLCLHSEPGGHRFRPNASWAALAAAVGGRHDYLDGIEG